MNFLIPRFQDIIDIIIITFIIYQTLTIVRKSGSFQILYGALFILLIYLVAVVMKLELVSGMLKTLQNYWILALVILFQPELRAMLARFNIYSEFNLGSRKKDGTSYFGALIDAISAMSFRKTGALIIIENKRSLNEYIHAGEVIDAVISLRLILTIFNTKSVLHDGAVIIRKGKLLAAKVVLPLSKNLDYTKQFGTRHLAAVGITESTDAFAIVVSEQTGLISVASKGVLSTNVAFEELMQLLTDAIR